MLKIIVDSAEEKATLRVEGQLMGPWVEELRRSCEHALAPGATLTVDVSDLVFADRDGVDLLGALRRRHVAIANCSPFVAELLKASCEEARDHGR